MGALIRPSASEIAAIQSQLITIQQELNGLLFVPDIYISPAITGAPDVGEVLTATPGYWTNSPSSRAYQWKRNGTPISGATAATYTVQEADSDQQITVTETATNGAGQGLATSIPITIGNPLTSFGAGMALVFALAS